MKLRLGLLLLLLPLSAYLIWRYAATPDTLARESRQIPVRSELVERVRAEPVLRLSGTLAANRSVALSPEVTGRILAIPVRSGERVKAGSELVRLDDAKQQAVQAELAAALRDEERKLNDMRRLVSRGAVTQSELEGQEASVAMANARLEAARVELSLRTLTAPFAGTVSLIDLSPGALVGSADTLLHLDDIDTLRLDLAVPERYLALLEPGMKVSASSSAWPGEQFAGTVSTLDSRVVEGTQNIRVRIEVVNAHGRLRPGMLMEVALSLPAREVTRIPAQALEFSGSERFVYCLEAGQVTRTRVEIDEQHGESVWIAAGLKAGDRIVVEGLVNLRDGARVRDLAEGQG
ncbi:efflux RND transporter periplasmic adaptor subunit [Aeromonas diversa]|uniref:efflux RND transporter periplasmic adaptor subunit n=1 Tax=Aeromonas diversa TaxID=502790 RepID=UPI0034626ECF